MSDAGNRAAPTTRYDKALARFRRLYGEAIAALKAQSGGGSMPDDAGASPGINEVLLAHPEAPLRLTVMMRRLGLKRGDIADGRTLRGLEFTCALCQDTGDCRDWLRSKETTGHHRFCPNARQLDRLRARLK